MNHEETITLTRSDLAALIEAAVTEALTEVAPVLERDTRRRLSLSDYRKERRRSDPEWAAARAADTRRRRATDPEYAERCREASRKYHAERRGNPDYEARKNADNRAYYDRNRDKINAAKREARANDRDYREREKEAARVRGRERYANDPDYRERKNGAKRERYANDPDYRERKNAADRARRARKKAAELEADSALA